MLFRVGVIENPNFSCCFVPILHVPIIRCSFDPSEAFCAGKSFYSDVLVMHVPPRGEPVAPASYRGPLRGQAGVGSERSGGLWLYVAYLRHILS